MSTAKADAALVAATLASKNVTSKITSGAKSAKALASCSTSATITSESTKSEEKPKFPRIFNKIILTLENSLLPEKKLTQTPSFLDGLDAETEKDLRILGCEQIQTAGILLKLPQVAMATGQVLFQRFFYAKSFVRHNMDTVAMSCVYLASKIEEEPRRIRDVMNVFHHIKQVRAQKDIAPMIVDQSYVNLKTQIIKDERRVLKELGFCVHVKHPHKIIVMYLQVLKYERNERLMQMSWNFMNDSLRTDVFMRYTPETIACACIYLSAKKLGIPLPRNPPWFVLFHAKEDDIVDICYRVMDLYMRPKANVEKLESAVEQLKKRYLDLRNKSKEQNTPPAVTTVDRNNASHNAWGGFIQRTVPLPLPKEEKSPKRESRSRTRSRTRSPVSKSKKKSRQYSRSPSSSPHNKHRKRKTSRHRERSTDKYEDYESKSSAKRSYNSSSNTEKYERFDKYEKYNKYEKYDKYRNYNYDKYRASSSSHKHRHLSDRNSKEDYRR